MVNGHGMEDHTHTKLIAIKANNIETVGEEDKHFMVSMEKVCEIIHS